MVQSAIGEQITNMKKNWSDLSPTTQRVLVVAGILYGRAASPTTNRRAVMTSGSMRRK